MLNTKFLLGLTLIVILSGSCHWENDWSGYDKTPIVFFDTCQSYDFDILTIPYSKLPFTGYADNVTTDTTSFRDSDGVILFEWQDKNYFHPVNTCHRAYALIDFYHRTGDTLYLNMLHTYVRRLISEAVEFDGAAYFPYQFDFQVHGLAEAGLLAPWYSGMAQGEALGVLTRAFNETGDSAYFEFAHKTFKSLQRLRGSAMPWTVFVDERGCFWIEEYPTAEPSMTLNGFISAIFGLYDYYQLTKNPEVGTMLKSCLNTVKNYVPLFRRKGKASYYGLTYQHYNGSYHSLHISQLRYLEKYTGDTTFGNWADTFLADYSKTKP